MEALGRKSSVLVTSGDVWLDFNPLSIPPVTADIVGIGMRVTAEVAQHFGVYFVDKAVGQTGTLEQPISLFLQKPAPAEIYRQVRTHDFYVDTGMWLLSAAALRLLFLRCGWNEKKARFDTADGFPGYLDLYTELGAVLGEGTRPPAALAKLGWRNLRRAVVPLPPQEAQFYHLGSSRQLFESLEQVQSRNYSPEKTLSSASDRSRVVRTSSQPVWIDGAALSASLHTAGHNLVTGLPAGSAVTSLAAEQCVDVSPVGRRAYALRPYHLDDSLRGIAGKHGKICGVDAAAWLAARGFPQSEADVFTLPLYPVIAAEEITQARVEWYFASAPDPSVSEWIRRQPLLSAAQIPAQTAFGRLFSERRTGYAQALRSDFESCLTHSNERVYSQDFAAIAGFCREQAPELGDWLLAHEKKLLGAASRPEYRSRLLMGLAAIGGSRSKGLAELGYRQLQSSIVTTDRSALPRPRLALKEDQIVWGRSPVRLDLAGGWTDTPPYCLENGGAVLNAAVLLNGQPPIQAFIRPLAEPHFRLRSIDLGSTEDIGSYQGLASFHDPASSFSLAKAALALAGFHPDFFGGKACSNLPEQLKSFGSGLEISLLSAVPKGSGLGTSSILGATLLGALNRACGLGWDEVDLYDRVLSLEQLLTTGGGWQDQAGALFRGSKLVQTQAGPAQTPTVRYLPAHLLGPAFANRTLLLYYTGVTRMAKSILREIVQDMFLRKTSTLRTLHFIRANAHYLYQAMQEGAPDALHRCIARSWALNQELDAGTSTPQVETIIATCGDHLAACKLLGAGGGGYMLICAKNPESGDKIRKALESRPPNSRARFIDFQVTDRALEVTVS